MRLLLTSMTVTVCFNTLKQTAIIAFVSFNITAPRQEGTYLDISARYAQLQSPNSHFHCRTLESEAYDGCQTMKAQARLFMIHIGM